MNTARNGIAIDFNTKTVIIVGKEMVDTLTDHLERPISSELCEVIANTIVKVKHPEYVDDGKGSWQLGCDNETVKYFMTLVDSTMEGAPFILKESI